MISANYNQRAQAMSNSGGVTLPATDVRGDTVATLDHWQTIDESSSDEEDEILWTGNDLDSDEDFVLIPHMRKTIKPSSSTARYEVTREVIQGIASLSFSQPVNDDYSPGSKNTNGRNTKSGAKSARGNHTNSRSVPIKPSVQQEEIHAKAKRSRSKRGKKEPPSGRKNAKSSTPASNDPKTRNYSSPPVESDVEVDTKYKDAVSFITSFLQTSATASQHTKLTFLQSLIIELGLMSPGSTLPASLNSATRFLKSHAFLNVRDYLTVRHEGVDKLQQVMFKSRKALVNDLRKNKGRRQLDRTWVKDHGLNVLLVQT